jgi:hypothetical protein
MTAGAQKLLLSQRWKQRHGPRSKPALTTPIMLAPLPLQPPAAPLLTAIDRARIAKWMAAQIVNYPPDRCLCCRRPIVYGAKWVELVNDNNRARFHFECAPAWRTRQEALARRALGLKLQPTRGAEQ